MSQIQVSSDLLNSIVRSANDMGKDGWRIKDVAIIRGTAADNESWVFDCDRGPESATESWRDGRDKEALR